MQKFEILYNIAFSANTDTDALLETVQQDILYETQQNVGLDQEYFSYTSQVGVGIVNDLNVKAYLDMPQNEKIAIDFVDYLKMLLTLDEFRDLFYDNKKLAEFFNSYYRKNINYSNQEQTEEKSDPNINLIEKKQSLFNQDEKYLKTNALTSYYTNTVDVAGKSIPNNYTNATSQTDFINFSGDSENYYVNIQINTNKTTIFTDDFSEYFADTCEGTINYTKYTYKNNFNILSKYGNIEEILKLKELSNSNYGPSKESLEKYNGLLPDNFLPQLALSNSNNSQQPSQQATITLADGIYYDTPNNQVISIPIAYDQNYLQNLVNSTASASGGNLEYNSLFKKANFKSFSEFSNWYGFQYKPFSPPFVYPEQANYRYIYQQVIDLIPQTYSIFDSGIFGTNMTSMGAGSMDNNPSIPNLTKPEFNFVKDPSWDNLDFIGQLFDDFSDNTLKINIAHRDPTKYRDVIVQYEYFSVGLLGPDNGVNSLSLDVFNNIYFNIDNFRIHFDVGDVVKSVDIKIYKNWPVRSPIVLSLRPAKNPNQILQYLVIYLEEFYDLSSFSYNEYIDVKSFDKCRLMYNGFVDQKYNDSFLQKYRPDNIPLNYVNIPANSAGFSIINGFSSNSGTTVNQKLFNIFNDSSLTLASLARRLNIPESAIYNVYIYGSHYFEKIQATSDADIIIVADVPQDRSYFKIGDIDFSIYNPQRFQFQLNEFAIPTFENSEYLSDRAFFVYFTQEDTFKILERIEFTTNITKENFKTKSIEISDSHFSKAETLYSSKDLRKFQKVVWNSIRVLVFSIQYLKFGKIVDRKASNQYLDDTERFFENFEGAQAYFLPIINNLKNELLSL
jgi:arsenate reductase-like glutaredoxin family protein